MGGGPSRTTIRYSKPKTQKIRSSNKDQQTLRGFGNKKNAFISFHMEDEAQVNLLRHQAKNDKFNLEFTDYSVKKPFDNKWKARCEKRIRQASVTIVMIGKESYKRPAVLWEINKSYELGKKVIGVRIRKDRNDPIPGPLLRNKAKIVNWNIKEIQKELNKTKKSNKKDKPKKTDK